MRGDVLAPADALLAGLPRADLDAASAVRFLHGQKLRAPASLQASATARVRVYGPQGLLGVAGLRDGALVPQRLVASQQFEPAEAPAK